MMQKYEKTELRFALDLFNLDFNFTSLALSCAEYTKWIKSNAPLVWDVKFDRVAVFKKKIILIFFRFD